MLRDSVHLLLLPCMRFLLCAFLVLGLCLNCCKTNESKVKAGDLERGRYLVENVAACLGCHSKTDKKYYGLPIIVGTKGMGGASFKFAGNTIYGKNITPDRETGIGTWSDDDIARALTQGISKDGTKLATVMPYYIYRNLTKADLTAIILYLRSLPAIKNAVPPNDTKGSAAKAKAKLEPLLAGYKSSFVKKGPKTNGEYLALIGKCIDCHSVGKAGVYAKGARLVGGREFRLPTGVVRSANLTPHKKAGIGNYTQKLFVDRFKGYAKFDKDVLLGQDPTTMAWSEYTHLKEADLVAIYEYLFSQPPTANFVEPFTPADGFGEGY